MSVLWRGGWAAARRLSAREMLRGGEARCGENWRVEMRIVRRVVGGGYCGGEGREGEGEAGEYFWVAVFRLMSLHGQQCEKETRVSLIRVLR